VSGEDQMDYCYEAEFVLEGVRVDKTLKEDNFSIDPDPSSDRRAILKYNFCMAAHSEKEAEDKAIHDVNNLLSFALLGLYQGNGSAGFSAKFLSIGCTNIENLIKAKQQPPMFGKIKFSTFYRFKDKTLKDILKELNKYSSVIPNNIWVALNFWRTGLSSDDEYTRFEQVWKAFEIFYRAIAGRTDVDILEVKNLLTKVLPPSNMQALCSQLSSLKNSEMAINVKILGCNSPLECLVKQNYTSSSGSTNYSQNLKIALANGNHHEALANTIMCLAKLRNNVFHANIFGDKERPLVFVGNSILEGILISSFLYYIKKVI